MWQDPRHFARTWRSQAGITGLETAIVLIAFVVVSSIFSFAALSTGLFSADKSKETIRAGLKEASATLNVKGSIFAKARTGGAVGAAIDEILFQVANAAGAEAVNLTQGQTVIRYSDANQTVIFDSAAEFKVSGIGEADDDTLVEEGEIVEIRILNLVSVLTADLSTSDTFVIEVIPSKGAIISFSRTLPSFLDLLNILR